MHLLRKLLNIILIFLPFIVIMVVAVIQSQMAAYGNCATGATTKIGVSLWLLPFQLILAPILMIQGVKKEKLINGSIIISLILITIGAFLDVLIYIC